MYRWCWFSKVHEAQGSLGTMEQSLYGSLPVGADTQEEKHRAQWAGDQVSVALEGRNIC